MIPRFLVLLQKRAALLLATIATAHADGDDVHTGAGGSATDWLAVGCDTPPDHDHF